MLPVKTFGDDVLISLIPAPTTSIAEKELEHVVIKTLEDVVSVQESADVFIVCPLLSRITQSLFKYKAVLPDDACFQLGLPSKSADL